MEYLKLDSANMFETLRQFPQQMAEACEIGKNIKLDKKFKGISKFIILGMGGSAIGGDLLRSYCEATSGADHIQIKINRTYKIPAYIDNDTCVIASSYSGNTEETIAAFEKASTMTDKLLCISTGGKITNIAQDKEIPVITIPGGFQPRCALAYSFFPLLHVVMQASFKSEALENTQLALKELDTNLADKSELFSIFNDSNPAFDLAQHIGDNIPVIYSSSEALDTVNLRWRCQIQENTKTLAFGNLLPEMNHNEINSWIMPKDLIDRFALVMLKDIDDNPRLETRYKAMEEILGNRVASINSVFSEGKHLLTRMFELINLGDWISYHMALNKGVDPTPIPLISKMKEVLEKM